ncbi:MAG TPA: hypothetical protein VIU61_14765 [Kofleriaceae bacterium]
MDDRVGTLALRVHSEGREAASRELAERFTRGVIERLAAQLEERMPGRLVFLRRLPLAWTLTDELESLASEIERAANELVLAVESTLIADDEPQPDADVAVFSDEVALVASAVLAQSRGRLGWFHHAGGVGDPVGALIANPPRAARVLERLARRDVLLDVVATLPHAAIAELVTRLVSGAARDAEPASIRAARTQLATRHEYTRLDPTTRTLVAQIYARAATRAAIDSAAPAQRADELESRSDHDDAAPSPLGAAPLEAQPLATGHPTVDEPGVALATQYAGLFYLVSPILELGLAEGLWQACLPEGEVIARALSALVPDPDDAAIAVIAGAARREITVDAAQVREAACATLAAIVSALPRGGRAALPAGLVRFVEHASGRLLVVTAIDAPFVLFAWPASHPDDAALGLAALLARWPAGTPLFGTRTVIELDRTGRCRHAAVASPEPFVIVGASAAEVALGSLVAGAAGQLVAARAGDVVDEVSTWVAQRLACRGRIVREPELVEVWLARDAVDLALRRAALDRDPGYVGWLDCTVRLRFEDPPLTGPS